ncbi:YHYH domain-containing protein [Candidatus Parcubacteria bacterium]|nr:YHYH domain-containing protein [Candidatus Parcubacteria bacterium]
MKHLIIKSSLILVVLLLLPFFVFAHPGRTDSKGCHTCRTNCTEKWGLEYNEYHCHAKKIKKARVSARMMARSK